MLIYIICGSQRPLSQSAHVGKYIQEVIKSKNINAELLDLGTDSLPLYDLDFAKNAPDLKIQWNSISQQLVEADAYVVISPEWNGAATPAIKNFFLYCKKEMAYKPAIPVGVSNSFGGGYVISDLRAFSGKNTYLNYIPEHFIVRNSSKVLQNHDMQESNNTIEDYYLKQRIDFGISLLVKHAVYLGQMREDGLPIFSLSPFGMS